jgi:iron complex transport system permease protein
MRGRAIVLYGIAFLVIALVTPWIGPEEVTLSEVKEFRRGESNPGGEIFWKQRLPRVLLALLAGGTLAVVGACFQVLFKNPLVEPFTLGISGGAALGAFLTISIPGIWFVWGPFGSVQLFAVLGASAALLLIYSLARKPQGMSVYTLLLAGVTLSIICGGAILLLTYLANPNALMVFQRWMMGGLDVIGFRELLSLGPLLVPGLYLLFYHANDLNHIALSEELALGQGVEVSRVRRNVFIGGGLATAAVVSLVGPIAFVGLIVPHAVRRLSGFDHRMVLPASFCLGGAALAVCDAVARTLIAPTELPVGIITAIIGGPLFIRLLVSRRWR